MVQAWHSTFADDRLVCGRRDLIDFWLGPLGSRVGSIDKPSATWRLSPNLQGILMGDVSIHSNPGRLSYLDGWRGLAILCVLAGHFLFLKSFNLGPFGVELFFVLSGRLMADILFVEIYPIPKFFQRRFSRVYPALFLFVAVSLIIFYGFDLNHINLLQALQALTFTYNYLAVDHPAHKLDHIWSLCIEEHAYLILAGIAVLSRRFSFSAPIVLWAITVASMLDGIVSTLVFHQDWFHAYWRTDVHIGSIFGSAAIYLQTRDLPKRWYLGNLTVFAGLAGLALNASMVPIWISFSLGTLLLAVSVNLLDYMPDRLKSMISFNLLTAVGVTSFSIYLIQQPFYIYAEGHHRPFALASCLVAVGLGFLSYRFFENPTRRWLNRWFAARAASRQQPLAGSA
jgi:peptidoglycan/LPS O-acetylase OafA/YrhL